MLKVTVSAVCCLCQIFHHSSKCTGGPLLTIILCFLLSPLFVLVDYIIEFIVSCEDRIEALIPRIEYNGSLM